MSVEAADLHKIVTGTRSVASVRNEFLCLEHLFGMCKATCLHSVYLSPKGPVVTTNIISIFLKRRQRLREIKKLDKIILLVNERIQS